MGLELSSLYYVLGCLTVQDWGVVVVVVVVVPLPGRHPAAVVVVVVVVVDLVVVVAAGSLMSAEVAFPKLPCSFKLFQEPYSIRHARPCKARLSNHRESDVGCFRRNTRRLRTTKHVHSAM